MAGPRGGCPEYPFSDAMKRDGRMQAIEVCMSCRSAGRWSEASPAAQAGATGSDRAAAVFATLAGVA
jgi:hypothetical protein